MVDNVHFPDIKYLYIFIKSCINIYGTVKLLQCTYMWNIEWQLEDRRKYSLVGSVCTLAQ